MTKTDDIVVERRDGVVHATLNRPAKLNAIHRGMWQTLSDLCADVRNDDGIKVVVIGGAGGNFSGGADLKEMHTMLANGESLAPNYRAVDDALTSLRRLDRPVIAMVDGSCMGGGCMITLTADFRITTQRSVFAITPARLGLTITPDQIQDLIQLIGTARAKEMLYLGRRVSAEEALNWGLVNRIVDEHDLDGAVQSLIDGLSEVSQHSVRTFKRVFGEMQLQLGDEALCERLYEEGFMGEDFKEGALAFLERRTANFPSNQ